jgi:hypothetical protein
VSWTEENTSNLYLFSLQFRLYACKHLLILIYTYIQQDATLHSLFYLETALHVSGGTTTHHQERKQLYLQHLVFVTPLLLPAAIAADAVELPRRKHTTYRTRRKFEIKNNVKVLLSLLPGVRKSISLKVPRFSPLLLLLRKVLRRRRIWSIVGMMPTAKIWRSGTKKCFSVILSTKSLTLTVPQSNPGLCDINTKIHLNCL